MRFLAVVSELEITTDLGVFLSAAYTDRLERLAAAIGTSL